MTINKVQSLIFLALATSFLSGCSAPIERMEKFTYEPSFPLNIPQANLPKNGSLFHAGEGLNLFNDSRAHRVGDIITINLEENFNAKKKDESNFDRSNNQDFGVTTPLNIFGQAVVSPASAPFASGSPTGIGIGYGSSGKFSGSSDIKQRSSLAGSIAVTVIQVVPNGNLVIRGEKWISIHEGDEIIRFAGIIRPQDIRPDNTIDSKKVADVRLIFKDTGMAGDMVRPGALTQFLSKYWPL